MGRVFKAFDPRVRRHLAIKILRQEGLENSDKAREFKERFFREGQICGRLSHQNIVIIYEMDEAQGQLFIAMEYVQGQPLSKLIGKEDALPHEDRMALLNQVASALDYAHRIGVVHRDIKPSNIIWSDSGQAKVTDFGMAKLTLDKDTNLTRPGTFMGTPRYASPEQINGKGICAQSDVFSFGILAYELVSGASPFPGSSISEILFKIAACQVSFEPIEAKLQLSNTRLKEIFAKVFQTEPEDRYPSAGAFMKAFEPAVTQALAMSGTQKIPLMAHQAATVRLATPDRAKTGDGEGSTVREKPVGLKKPDLAKPDRDSPQGKTPPFRPKIKLPDFPRIDPEESIDTPPRPGGTLRIPKSFINQNEDEVRRESVPKAVSPPASRSQKTSSQDPTPPIPSKAVSSGNENQPPPIPPRKKTEDWVAKNVPQPPHAGPQRPSHPPPQFEAEREPANYWWLLGVAAIAAVIVLIGWIAWPELKTIWTNPEPVQAANIAEPTRPPGGDPTPETPTENPATPADPTTESSRDLDPAPAETLPEEPDTDPQEGPSQSERSDSRPPGRDLTENEMQNPPADRTPSRETPNMAKPSEPDPKVVDTPIEKMPESAPAEPPIENSPETTPPKASVTPPAKPEMAPKPVMVQPVITHRERPVFPAAGREAGVEGKVVLEAELRFDGQVGNISVLQTLGGGAYGFEDAAIKALLNYRFTPGEINGKPSTMRQKFSFDFDLTERKQIGTQRVGELANESLPPATDNEKAKQFGIVRPAFYHKVAPIYPEAGAEAGLMGSVVLRASLRANGTIDDIRVVQGLGDGQYGFEDAAIAALKQWKFHPGTINGEPSDMPIRVSLQFQLKTKQKEN